MLGSEPYLLKFYSNVSSLSAFSTLFLFLLLFSRLNIL